MPNNCPLTLSFQKQVSKIKGWGSILATHQMSEILGSHRLEPFLEGATERESQVCKKYLQKKNIRPALTPLALPPKKLQGSFFFFCWDKVAPDGICACVWMCINFMLMWKFLCSVHLLEVFRRCKWRICVCVFVYFEKVGFRVLLFPPVTCTWWCGMCELCELLTLARWS